MLANVLTLGHDRVSLADPLQGLQLELPLLEDVESPVRSDCLFVAIEKPLKIGDKADSGTTGH